MTGLRKRERVFASGPDARRGRSTKVFALGGTGRVGRPSAKLLAQSEIVSEIAIGSRDFALARRTAAEIGPKAVAVEVDATDERRLASAAAPYDLIVSTAGPDFRVALPVMRAAIAAGTNCVDISADGPSTEKALDLDGEAKKAGVTVLTGIGHTPGISNLLMRHAASQLETVEYLTYCTWWALSRETLTLFGDPDEMRRSGRVNASWQTILAWVAGRVRTYRDRRWVDVDPFEESTEVSLPTGGAVAAVPFGGTEPITLPRWMPGVRSVSVLLGLHPPQLNELLRDQARRIATGKSDAATATIAFLDALTAEPDRWLESPRQISAGFGMVATAMGLRGGQRVRYSCWPAGPWESTVGPLAAAALGVLRGDILARGVLSPEAVLEPIPFLKEAARYGPKPPADGPLLDESREILA